MLHVKVEQHAQHQKEEDDDDLAHGRQHDVLLRIARGGAAHVALHEVLVQSGHGDQQHDAREKHLPEIAVRGGIVEEEDPRHGRRRDFAHRIRKGEIQPPHDEDDRQDEARHETEGLERIGPDQRLDTPLLRIEPDEGHRNQRIEPERQPVTVENEQL